jgi:hypothetical protein
MNIKKLFATLAGVSLFAQTVVPFGALAATYSQELQDAYNWAYGKSITTMSSIDNANMYGAITRAELAKMLANWAKDKGQTPDTSKACTFTDTASVKGDLATAIVEACQLGLMGQGITAFRPYDTISRAEFGTALSRALWGDKYEGGTPYYAKHLDALKAAGIMTQIANAESTKEVRGYVMLMLMRSESAAPAVDCEDAIIKAACVLDSDECPAACKTTEEPTEKVKAGDLAVTATAAAGKSVIINGVNDLDTITFKTSEEVELTKVVLERYGYSTSDEVVEVRLEDEDGNKIADERNLNNKDQVTLTIKKDYRSINGTINATVVATVRSLPSATGDPYYESTLTDPSLRNGSNLGFKVVDVTSTAKNVDLGKYGANLYDIVSYSAGTLELAPRAANKSYNYEAGESYEIAKFKTTNNGTNAITVNGFTLHQYGTMSAEDFVENVVVTANGEKVSGLKTSFNKDDELVVSFNDVEVAARKNVTFAVSANLGNEFDEYTKTIAYAIQDSDDVSALEKKTGARVSVTSNAGTATVTWDAVAKKRVNGANDWSWPVYTFNGGKIKLTNTKLGNIDAAAGSTDVVIAEGTLTISEAIKGTFSLTADNDGIDSLTMVVAGEEFDSKKSGRTFTFSNIEIEKG